MCIRDRWKGGFNFDCGVMALIGKRISIGLVGRNLRNKDNVRRYYEGGIAVSALALVAAVVCAIVFEIGLFVVVGLFGLLEFVAEVQASSAMSRLRMADLGPDVPAESLLKLRRLVRPVFRAEDENRLQRVELGRLARMLSLARITPMPRLRTVLWGLVYLALAGGFIAIIVITSSNPAAGLALEVLR